MAFIYSETSFRFSNDYATSIFVSIEKFSVVGSYTLSDDSVSNFYFFHNILLFENMIYKDKKCLKNIQFWFKFWKRRKKSIGKNINI